MTPQRIVSLVPSITETLIAFGIPPVGRTSFCVEPRGQVERIAVVGGTKTPKVAKIVELHPDLVIANREENRKEDVEALKAQGLNVWVTYPTTVEEAALLQEEIGTRIGASKAGHDSAREVRRAMEELSVGPNAIRPRVAALIWKDPWMAIGGNCYSNDLLRSAGGRNPFEDRESRYPQVSDREILGADLDLLLLPSEPYRFSEEERAAWSERFRKAGRERSVELFSGEELTWFGPRTAGALRRLAALLKPLAVGRGKVG